MTVFYWKSKKDVTNTLFKDVRLKIIILFSDIRTYFWKSWRSIIWQAKHKIKTRPANWWRNGQGRERIWSRHSCSCTGNPACRSAPGPCPRWPPGTAHRSPTGRLHSPRPRNKWQIKTEEYPMKSIKVSNYSIFKKEILQDCKIVHIKTCTCAVYSTLFIKNKESFNNFALMRTQTNLFRIRIRPFRKFQIRSGSRPICYSNAFLKIRNYQ